MYVWDTETFIASFCLLLFRGFPDNLYLQPSEDDLFGHELWSFLTNSVYFYKDPIE